MAGLCSSARATISRCARPPESAITGAFARSVRWNFTSRSSAAAREAAAPIPKKRPWKYRFSHTVSARSRVFVWGTTPISCLAIAGWRTTSTPPTNASPDVGITRVVSMLAVVVLPAPLGPSRPKISPSQTVRLSPSTAVTPPG